MPERRAIRGPKGKTNKEALRDGRVLAKQLGRNWTGSSETGYSLGRDKSYHYTFNGPLKVYPAAAPCKGYWCAVRDQNGVRILLAEGRTPRSAAKAGLASLRDKLEEVEEKQKKLKELVDSTEPIVKELYRRKK